MSRIIIDNRRIQKYTHHTTDHTEGDVVVYWMNRDCRVHDNWALLHAQEIAIREGKKLIVVYNLVQNFLGGSGRQYMFKLEGLQDVYDDLQKLHIPYYICTHKEGDIDTFVSFLQKHKIHTLVTDFSPLRIHTAWLDAIAKKISCPVYVVDTHNVIPAWIVSEKAEYAAYTIRPKIHKQIAEFLTDIPSVASMPIDNMSVLHAKKDIDFDELHTHTPEELDIYVKQYTGGYAEAKKRWKHFLKHKLQTYDTDRNNPLMDGQSGLSPYLHYGHISAQRIALDMVSHAGVSVTSILHSQKNGSDESEPNPYSAFLEELIVRRELADNFCLYNPKTYDTPMCFPAWAQASLEKRKGDDRAYVYSRKQFEQAKTHDELWNACQREMLQTGKMHGYMRMYWAKKILEWSVDYKDAMRTAIYLNDRYELDGRDPNGYAGIAWSIGGVHDRAWFERPIFGLVRYMARSGVEKRCDADEYIALYQPKDTK